VRSLISSRSNSAIAHKHRREKPIQTTISLANEAPHNAIGSKTDTSELHYHILHAFPVRDPVERIHDVTGDEKKIASDDKSKSLDAWNSGVFGNP
jgi:hypothetical protein